MKKLLLTCAVLFLFFPGGAKAFEDVESNAIERLIEAGTIKDKAHFFPDLKCTRAQFVVWALRNVNEDVEGKSIREPFTDVHAQDAYAPFIARAWELGVIPTENKFSPKKPIQKIDALKIALKLEGVTIPIAGLHLQYIDLPKDAEGNGVIAKALRMRITKQLKKNIFGTHKTLTRLECAKILDAISLSRKSEDIIFNTDTKNDQHRPKQEIFDEVWNIIHTKYLRADEIDSEELMETIIRKAVGSLDDPHTVYFNKEETDNFLTGVGIGNQYGIGAQVGLNKEGQIQIIKPLKNSPSEKAGLRPGDVIIEVDGIDVSQGDMTLEEIVSLIKGENKTKVKITLQRRAKKIERTIVRGPIELTSTTPHIQDEYLVLEVDFFGSDTVSEILNATEEYKQYAENGIILDLRNNPGGFLDAAIELLSHLLPKDSIAVKTRGRDITHTEKVRGPGDLSQYPLVVLVNERSASASEIVSGAVQDLHRGIVVGTTTYGKGTAQELMQFDDGSALKITVAEWLTPNDRSINDIGITPDLFFDDIENNQASWAYAARLIKRGQWK